MKKVFKYSFIVILTLILMCGCEKDENGKETESTNLKDITYLELMEKINNKEAFIIEFVQTGCTNCAAFTPKFKSVLEEYNIVAYSLNISTSVNAEEIDKFLDQYGITGTPAVLFLPRWPRNKFDEKNNW